MRRARGSLGARAIFSTVGVTVAIGSWTISCSCAVGRWLGLLSTASSATLRGAMRGSLGTLNPPRSKAPARLMIDSERSSASVDLGAGDSAGISALGAAGMGAGVGVSVGGAAEGASTSAGTDTAGSMVSITGAGADSREAGSILTSAAASRSIGAVMAGSGCCCGYCSTAESVEAAVGMATSLPSAAVSARRWLLLLRPRRLLGRRLGDSVCSWLLRGSAAAGGLLSFCAAGSLGGRSGRRDCCCCPRPSPRPPLPPSLRCSLPDGRWSR